MTANAPISERLRTHFGDQEVPAIFFRLASHESHLSAIWGQYQVVMLSGEIDLPTKELMALAVAVAKSNDYVIAWQKQQLRRCGLGPDEEREALAVAGFFEGFDSFAHALHVDSDLRPRKLAAGDTSLIDQEIDVNVTYVLASDDPLVGQVYEEIRLGMGIPFVPNIFKALAHQPAMLKAKWELYKAVMRGGRLRPRSKELIAMAVSAVNACFY